MRNVHECTMRNEAIYGDRLSVSKCLQDFCNHRRQMLALLLTLVTSDCCSPPLANAWMQQTGLKFTAPDPVIQDRDLKARIEAALRIDPAFRANDLIAVNVDSGVADLGGTVESWGDHHAATQDALKAGAREVVNHIRVREDPSGSTKAFVYKGKHSSRVTG
jgi:hypothetical protein